MTRSGTPLLKVRNLTRQFPVKRGWFGKGQVVRAVDGISFDLHRGETLGLVGESGCGKSTAARSILRLLEPTSGEIEFAGEDVLAMGPAALRRLRRQAQIIFQDPNSSLNPRMTVGATLHEVLKVHGLGGGRAGRRARARELLDRVGLLPEYVDRYPHELSGGQRQRIGIARALSVEPELIVFDEPVSALDVSVRAQVINLLEDLQEELDLTYLFIAHDLSMVEHVSDRVAVMYLGRIVEIGPVEAIYRNPRHPYTKALLSAVPRPEPGRRPQGGRILLQGEVPSPVSIPSGCPFHPRCPHPARNEECTRVVPTLDSSSGGTTHQAACIKLEASQEAFT